jgi:hypothetical protein
MHSDELFDLLAIADDDRDDCRAVLDDGRDVGPLVAALERSLGSFGEVPVEGGSTDPLAWLHAYLLFTPTLVAWHRDHSIPDEVTRATLADLGRHVAISRRVTGGFSFQTWDWLQHHLTGQLFALGRLQFELRRSGRAVDGVMSADDWTLAAHIPEAGPLSPALVDESFDRAREFFPGHFPERPVRVVTCDSWMLDPYLAATIGPRSNTGAFARRFTPIGPPTEGDTEALYFVFRTRDLGRVGELPRETSLQRVVLERIDAGGTWQVAAGYLLL